MRRLAVVLALWSAAWAQAAPGDLRRVHGEFECALGPRWAEQDAWKSRLPAYVFSRAEAEEPFPAITVEKFSPGNPLYPTPNDYLKAAGIGDGATRRAGYAVALKRKILIWERRAVLPRGPRETDRPSEQPLREQFVILERSKSFFVLTLRATPDRFEGLRREFLGFLKSFRFLDRGS